METLFAAMGLAILILSYKVYENSALAKARREIEDLKSAEQRRLYQEREARLDMHFGQFQNGHLIKIYEDAPSWKQREMEQEYPDIDFPEWARE